MKTTQEMPITPNAEEEQDVYISKVAQLARASLQNPPSEHAAAVKDSILRENEDRFKNRQEIDAHIEKTRQLSGERYMAGLQEIADKERASDAEFATKHQDILGPQALADMEAAKPDSLPQQRAA
jgi:hypothetical protein